MQITCPCCAARFPIEAALTDEAARSAVATALALTAPLGDRLMRYIGLFRPAKRALAWNRAARLLDELLGMIQAGRIERKGRAWAAPETAWAEGLEQILARRDKLDLPLSGHGYLLEIVAREGERKEAASRPLHPSHRGASQGPKSMAETLSESRRAQWDRELGLGAKHDKPGGE
jgi:hypothetical protein